MNQRQLGVAIGWEDSDATQRRISRWEQGQDVPEVELRKLADFFDVSFFEFFQNVSVGTVPEYFDPVPVISWVQAGSFSEAIDAYPEGVSGEREPVRPRNKVGPRSFALVVEGDSMRPRFMPGDIIIIDPDRDCENGDLCVVKYNDEVTFKRIRFQNGDVVLRPLNPKFPDITIRQDSEIDFQVVGRIVDMIPSFDFR